LCTIPFSSSRKRGSIVLKHPSQDGMVRIYTKGAPDMLFPKVSHVKNDQGEACHRDDSVACPE